MEKWKPLRASHFSTPPTATDYLTQDSCATLTIAAGTKDRADQFLGIGNYTEEGFGFTEREIPTKVEMFKRALKIPGLKIIYGTDAVAGAHGHNGEEYIARVMQGGEDPMAGIISATSLSAQSLRLQDQIGTIAPGMQADIIAMEGNPLTDPTSVRRVEFVMKGGTIFKNVIPASQGK